ncbi:CLTR2 protein, partial [Polyodon spathula]|nr:CLTR2 protein [Polyodon spathula]
MFLLSLAAVAVHGFYFSAADASIQNVKSSSTAAENKSRCNVVDKTFTSVFLPSVYVIVFFVGVISNCWGLRSLLAKWRTIGCINVFVLNLGIADLLYVITLPFLVSRGLACLNSALNPLVYLVIDDKVIIKMHDVSKMARRSLVHLVARKSTQSSMDRLDFT